MPYSLLYLFSLVLLSFSASAQLTSEDEKQRYLKEQKEEREKFSKEADTNYILPYHEQLVLRVYTAKKWNNLSLHNVPGISALRYRPNSSYNIGIGGTYKGLTINLAYGFGFLGFLNPRKELGVTKYLDLQSHMYGRKWLIDVFAQFYEGFYLFPKGTATVDGDSYYVRPDLNTNTFGASVQYVFNNRKFSYRASVLQNEWQKKSSGTLLLGVEAYYGNMHADSSIVPKKVDSLTFTQSIYKSEYVKLGPSVGYAYTLIVKKHFFATGSLSGNVAFGNTATTSDFNGQENNFSIIPGAFYRVFAGYNGARWALSAIYTSNNIAANPGSAIRSVINTANVRFNLVYRFAPNKKLKKTLDKVRPEKG